jgi:hypothetical protein
MNGSKGVTALAVLVAVASMGPAASAQRRRPSRSRADAGVVAAPPQESRTIAIPVAEASSMLQHMRVWLFTPPAGSTAFGLDSLGQGDRIWALLPSCRAPNPDDPRDPCPVGRVTIEVLTGSGQVQTYGPVDVVPQPNARRVQSFVIPPTAEIIRIKLLRNDGTLRYEAAVHRQQLGNLPAPEGTARGNSFSFDLTRYPAS